MMNKGQSQDCFWLFSCQRVAVDVEHAVKEGSLLKRALGRLHPEESPGIQL